MSSEKKGIRGVQVSQTVDVSVPGLCKVSAQVLSSDKGRVRFMFNHSDTECTKLAETLNATYGGGTNSASLAA